jgi:hypothetical protein
MGQCGTGEFVSNYFNKMKNKKAPKTEKLFPIKTSLTEPFYELFEAYKEQEGLASEAEAARRILTTFLKGEFSDE